MVVEARRVHKPQKISLSEDRRDNFSDSSEEYRTIFDRRRRQNIYTELHGSVTCDSAAPSATCGGRTDSLHRRQFAQENVVSNCDTHSARFLANWLHRRRFKAILPKHRLEDVRDLHQYESRIRLLE